VFHLIEIGAASAEDIDNALKFGPGFRAAAAGILETADMGGLDVWCTVQDNLFKALDRSDAACDLLRAKVQDGKLGVKTGEGFFGYPGDKKREAKDAFNRRLLTQFMTSRQYE
jgi:3-hydroxybutyryl-CoA dehydrogenase